MYVVHKYISHHLLILTAVGIVQGGEAIAGPPLRSLMSKAVAVEDQGTCCFFVVLFLFFVFVIFDDTAFLGSYSG